MVNGSNDGMEVKVKICPFSGTYCIKERCSLHMEMTRNTGGLQQKFTLCAVNAMVMMLSEINAKTQPPQQKMPKITLPNLVRG